jgi:predicted AlkP superfamily pyrophosphatase or phosphodiesterase
MLVLTLAFLLTAPNLEAARRPLLLISIDGLDHRYLRDRDQLGMKIPNLRRLIDQGAWADGVIGVMPTVTFPSHTTMVTGVRPDQHGIISNNDASGRRLFEASLLKVPTLWDAAHKAGLKTGNVYWPVTVGAPIDFNLPEYFEKRLGGGMELRAVESKTTPGLVGKIAAKYPSFTQQWVDDRIRTLATIYLLQNEKVDFILLHLIDHDAEAHENGPFTREAKAILEYTDELLGRILAATPKNWVVALVSDHGFERSDKVVNLPKVRPEIRATAMQASTDDPATAEWMRANSGNAQYGIGKEISEADWKRFLPTRPKPLAVFLPMQHYLFTANKDAPAIADIKHGEHGYFPLRENFRSTFLLWGNGVKRERLPEIDMLSIAGRLAQVLDLKLP